MWFNIETEIIKKLKQRAKENLKTIVLPEATDLRTLEATDKICREGFCKIILIGNEKEILSVATENKLDISNAKIVNPKNSEKYNEYVNAFYELRKAKGITKEQAEEMMLDGTAPASVICEYLKRGGPKARLQKEKDALELELIKAKTENLKMAQNMEESLKKAIEAFTDYRGTQDQDEEYDEFDE